MQTREFKLHPAMLNNIIRSQSGTPQKALLELVMNSVDAGATRISVTVDEKGFVVDDDGRGLDRKDLEAYWDTFGTPHEPGDVPFGVFRIGRGQIMSLARVSFRTHRMEMVVDFAARPGVYDLIKHTVRVPGMRVSGTWVESVRRRALAKSTTAELKRLCRWVSVAVTVNGMSVSDNPAGRAWQTTTDDAYFELGLDEPLRIYNLGAFVCEFSPTRYGIGGDVVSRKQLALNTARNEVLSASCPVWERIEEVLQRQRSAALVDGVLTKESQRQAALSMLVRGEVGMADLLDKPIVTLAGGMTATLRDLAGAKVLGIASIAESTRGEKLNGNGTFILSAASARTMGLRDAGDLVRLIGEQVEGDKRLSHLTLATPHVVEVTKEYEARVKLYQITDASGELKRDEQAKLALLETAHDRLVAALQAFGWRHIHKRTLRVSRLVGALACTDGKTHINVDVAYLKRCFASQGGLLGLAHTLVHEYAHSHLKYEDNHDFEFYLTVHDAWSNLGVLGAAWEMQTAGQGMH